MLNNYESLDPEILRSFLSILATDCVTFTFSFSGYFLKSISFIFLYSLFFHFIPITCNLLNVKINNCNIIEPCFQVFLKITYQIIGRNRSTDSLLRAFSEVLLYIWVCFCMKPQREVCFQILVKLTKSRLYVFPFSFFCQVRRKYNQEFPKYTTTNERHKYQNVKK